MLKRMDELEVGDVLKSDSGNVVVKRAYDVHTPKRMFEIELENGEKIKASGNHLWYIETINDIEFHRERKKIGKNLLKKIPDDKIKILQNLAEYNDTDTDDSNISINEAIKLLNVEKDDKIIYLIVRIMVSIGHILEENILFQDELDGSVISSKKIKKYNAVKFAQQFLSLSGKKNFSKRYPLVVGRVVNTEELLNIYKTSNIPTINDI